MRSRLHASGRLLQVLSRSGLVLFLAALIVLPLVGRQPTARADMATTVTGDVAWKWDPANPTDLGAPYASPRSVSVDQTANLVSQVLRVSWQNFSASDMPFSTVSTHYPVRVYQCDTAVPSSPADCFGTQTYGTTHPGAGNVPAQSNFVEAVTAADGSGSVDFPILTVADNPSLGCAPTHACSLLIEPITGGDSDGKDSAGNPGLGDGTAPQCGDHTLDYNLNPNTYVGNFATVNATPFDDWDKGCNWAGRIVVPLNFGPTPTSCRSRSTDFATEGSPLLQRAMDQWRAGLCRNSANAGGLEIGYTGLSEYQARKDFQNRSTDVALTSQPEDQPSRPATYAPVAVSSIDVGYYVDSAITGKPITDLRLNARLLAKMLTQSYSVGLPSTCSRTDNFGCAPEVAGNPSSVFTDPEFLKLNPEHNPSEFPTGDPGSSFPTVVYGGSDQTYQLTRWIESDPGAAAFLNGQPDASGMRVNRSYLPTTSPKYPVAQFTANDPGHTVLQPNCGSNTDDSGNVINFSCLNAGLQNTWFPVVGLRNVAKMLLSGRGTAKSFASQCSGTSVMPTNGICVNYPTNPNYPLGQRAFFAVVASGDTTAYRFPAAQLETRTGSGQFVGSSTVSVSAALANMHTGSDGITQSPSYATVDAAAYPLASVVYALVPTCGLTRTKAAAMAGFLRYISSDQGNEYGLAPGELAPGYLALPDSLRARTGAIAAQVQTEGSCQAPSHPRHVAGSSGAVSQSPGVPPVVNPPAPPANPRLPAANGSAGAARAALTPSVTAASSPSSLAAGLTRSQTPLSGPAAVILPLVLGVGGLLVLAGPLLLLSGTAYGSRVAGTVARILCRTR